MESALDIADHRETTMSLSMQMTRGTWALSLLLLLGLVAVATRHPATERLGAVPVVVAAPTVCELPAPRGSGWRLAQTPADLGPLARRWESCRA
jgi:hypothetical protein